MGLYKTMKRNPVDTFTASAVLALNAMAIAILIIALVMAMIAFVAWDFSIFIEIYKVFSKEWGVLIRIFLLIWIFLIFVSYEVIRKTTK